ncbi:hypothetical protein [Sphingobacterium pedocola]|uniref:DUF4374 domain-containing protein n=1 Tax=Sphingobacterium pedocola TaxID=2082722 RepID=A0ABR9T8K2_9SPHI|nr:hypothetical protein [Sphingobacterium pedocola]MBE8721664.1 hypothetical protein [Sphingobacterium pedocola]
MNKNLLKTVLFGSAIVLGTMVSCNKNDGPDDTGGGASGPDNSPRKYITLTAAFPDAETNTAGNGGSLAYALTLEEALDASKEVNIWTNGYGLRSQRTARVQGSVNGNFLYNIQYTGVNGGIFNKYRVSGGKAFEDTNEELNVSGVLGTSPRWVKAAEGIGVGVNISGASAPIDPVKAEAGTQTYEYTRGTASIALINLDDPRVPNTTEFEFPLTQAEKEAGYSVGRLDVPVIRGNKIFIGCAVSKADPNKLVKTVNSETQAVTWSWAGDAPNIKGTATLVVDYPSLANPKLIWSTQSTYGNNSYRTMTQYIGTDGHIYQSTGVNTTSYPHILRIDKNTNDYDNTYLFDLSQALGTGNLTGIRAWRYIKDGIGIVLYTETGVAGGYVALVDLNAKTATKLTTENQTDGGFSGLSASQNGGTALQGSLSQFQNIGLAGDYVYLPLTPNGKDGNLYLVNWKTKTIAKGIKLKGQSGSFYLGAY